MKILILFVSILIIIVCLLGVHFQKKNWTSKTSEIHFMAFWTNDMSAQKRVIESFEAFNNPKIRILQKIIIKKEKCKKIFKNVQSDGKKHLIDDVPVFIIEVLSKYSKKKTFGHPEGEMVNEYMYKFKTIGRGDSSNYKIAHGSFNVKESQDFLKEYYKDLGAFSNFSVVVESFNKGNFFWFYDQVTQNDEKTTDVDLVVDSVPATCFFLRTTKESFKAYATINKKSTPFDLRDFEAEYYPKSWLLDIKNNSKITKLDHFMLGLYHMYVHKNGIQPSNRIKKLKEMSNELGYQGKIDFFTLLRFLVKMNYTAKKCIDSNVGFFIKHEKRSGPLKEFVIKFQNAYYYKFRNSIQYKQQKEILEKLSKYEIAPKLLDFNDALCLMKVEHVGDILTKVSKDDLNNIKFKKRINYIKDCLKKENITHRDIHLENLCMKNRKLYIIDFDHAHKNSNKPRACQNFPNFEGKHTFTDYIKDNKCFHRFKKSL